MTMSISRKTTLFVTFAIVVATLFMVTQPLLAAGCNGGAHGSC